MALEWFKGYLGNRQQYVQYKNSKSDTEMIPCGVAQGSVLGPLLFYPRAARWPRSGHTLSIKIFCKNYGSVWREVRELSSYSIYK